MTISNTKKLLLEALCLSSKDCTSERVKTSISKALESLEIEEEQQLAKVPKFPSMLRKMWTGEEVAKWIDENWPTGEAPATPEAPTGYVTIPIKAPEGLLTSMAMRNRHDYWMLDEDQRKSLLIKAKQVHEEVVGTGFWKYAEEQDKMLIEKCKDENPLQLSITASEFKDLARFCETCEDNEEYDVPKERMVRLAQIGLVRRVTGSVYEVTEAGYCVMKNKLDSLEDLEKEDTEAIVDLLVECDELLEALPQVVEMNTTVLVQLIETKEKVQEALKALKAKDL